MVKRKIEPSFGDAPPDDESERFVVEPRPRPSEGRAYQRSQAEADGPSIPRRLLWLVCFLCLFFLGLEALKWHAERSESPVLNSLIERVQHDFSMARHRLHNLPIRHLASSTDAVRGRELRRNCEDLGTAFVANPQPETRELMLQYCQAYEHHRATGELPKDLPAFGR